jgi:hypothetical protein
MIVRSDRTYSGPGLKGSHPRRGPPRPRTGRRFHLPAQQGKQQQGDDGRLDRGQKGMTGFHEEQKMNCP